MDFRLSAEEEELRNASRRSCARNWRRWSEFENAPDIFEGSRWKSRAKLSRDPEINRYLALMEELAKRAEAKGYGISTCPRNTAAWTSATWR
jgi:hypothetical protein